MFLLSREISSNPDSAAKTPGGRKSKPKGKGRGKFGAASVPAPIPDSAKPASKKVSHNRTVVGHKPSVATPLKAAEFSEGERTEKHAEGQHHRDNHCGSLKGHKGEHSSGGDGEHFTSQNNEGFSGHRGDGSMDGHRGHGGEELKDGHNRHEGKRVSILSKLSAYIRV